MTFFERALVRVCLSGTIPWLINLPLIIKIGACQAKFVISGCFVLSSNPKLETVFESTPPEDCTLHTTFWARSKFSTTATIKRTAGHSVHIEILLDKSIHPFQKLIFLVTVSACYNLIKCLNFYSTSLIESISKTTYGP